MRLLVLAAALFIYTDAPWWVWLLYFGCWWIDAKVWEAMQ